MNGFTKTEIIYSVFTVCNGIVPFCFMYPDALLTCLQSKFSTVDVVLLRSAYALPSWRGEIGSLVCSKSMGICSPLLAMVWCRNFDTSPRFFMEVVVRSINEHAG